VLRVMIPGMTTAVSYLFSRTVSEKAVLLAVGRSHRCLPATAVAERGGRTALPSNSPGWVGMMFGAFSGFVSHIAHAGRPCSRWVLPRAVGTRRAGRDDRHRLCVHELDKRARLCRAGPVHAGNLMHSAMLMPLALGATWAGVHVVRRIDAALSIARSMP
jgi:hypothetical protein